MDSKEQVQKLIRGSENIDRMKREITLVVSTLLGLLSEVLSYPGSDVLVSLKNSRGHSFSFNNFGYQWNIMITAKGRLYAECIILGNGPEYELEAGFTPRFYSPIGKVKAVHEGLHVLVTGLMQFEAMRQHLQPFLDAADYKF